MVSTVEIASTVVPILVVALVPIGRIRSKWHQPAPILLASTLPFGLVGGYGMVAPVATYVLLIGFATPESEITLITKEQKSSSLVFPSKPHTATL